MEVGAPDYRIKETLGLILTPRRKDLIPVLGSVVTARRKITINLIIAQEKSRSLGL